MTARAAKALAQEAQKPEFIDVVFRGDTYKLPGNPEDYDLEFAESLEDENYVSALRALLGAEQWQTLKRNNNLKIRDLGEVTEVFLQATNLDLGKSPDSTS
jgi:hypothetical protein